MEKAKRRPVTHNTTKIKALLFLEMRKRSGNPLATARQIAQAINGKPRSLYVLLERWETWQLVVRDYESTPYRYEIADEGLRYLSKIEDWFFPGYYSRKRKRRVPGYRGKAADMKQEIAIAAKAAFYAYDTKRGELFYFTAPFTKAENFVREPIVDGKYKRWEKDRLLLARFPTICDAFNAIKDIWGLPMCRPMGQAMVDAGLANWSSDEEKQQ